MAKGGERPYRGAAGTTRKTETSVSCAGCDIVYGAAWYLSLDATDAPTVLTLFLDDGYPAINTMTCPECGGEHVAEEPLLVHQPARNRLFLVIPPGQRHRLQQFRAAAQEEIGRHPGDIVPDYALNPTVVIGFEALCLAIRGRPRDEAEASASLDAPRNARRDTGPLAVVSAPRLPRPDAED